jgi:hypothetical protein
MGGNINNMAYQKIKSAWRKRRRRQQWHQQPGVKWRHQMCGSGAASRLRAYGKTRRSAQHNGVRGNGGSKTARKAAAKA